MKAGGEWRLGAPWGPSARRLAVVLLAASALATGAAWYGNGVQGSPPQRPPPAFYQLPDPLPLPEGAPGQLIRAMRIAGPAAPAGARAWAILYHSRSADGRDVAVSGMVVAPSPKRGRAPAGGRPVVAWAHATAGLADRCAPSSRGLAGLRAFGRVWLARLLDRGYVVVATDYEGLGTPGVHPYLVGKSEGHSLLDAVRAAGQLRAARAGGRVALWGFSQGGHAVLWAGQLAPSYAPELLLAGLVSVSPGGALAALDREPFHPAPLRTTEFGVLIAAAWHEVYDAPLDILTPAGRAAAERLLTACPGSNQGGEPALARDPRKVGPWPGLFASNAPGRARVDAPVLVVQGAAEGTAPTAVVRALTARLCELGGRPRLSVYPGVHHGKVMEASGPDVLAWIDARLAGVPAGSSCPA